MIKNVFTFLMSLLFFPTLGEKICTDIWTIDNNVNGVTLYKVSLHMCTEGIISPNLNNPIFLDPSLADHNFNSSLLNLTNLTLNNQSVIMNTPSPAKNAPSPTKNTPSPTENTPDPTIINNEIIESHEQNSLFFNSTNNTNSTNKSNNLEPVHIVLISVSSIIILSAMTIITYIIIKKHHTCCKNKICIEENQSKPNKTSLYKQDKEDNQNNIKLTINTQTKKLRAVERFKNPKKPIPIRKSRFKTAIKNINNAKNINNTKNINNAKNINNTKKKTNGPHAYPPGMDVDQKTKQLPHLPTTPPPSPPLKVTKPIVSQSKLIENGHDIV